MGAFCVFALVGAFLLFALGRARRGRAALLFTEWMSLLLKRVVEQASKQASKQEASECPEAKACSRGGGGEIYGFPL